MSLYRGSGGGFVRVLMGPELFWTPAWIMRQGLGGPGGKGLWWIRALITPLSAGGPPHQPASAGARVPANTAISRPTRTKWWKWALISVEKGPEKGAPGGADGPHVGREVGPDDEGIRSRDMGRGGGRGCLLSLSLSTAPLLYILYPFPCHHLLLLLPIKFLLLVLRNVPFIPLPHFFSLFHHTVWYFLQSGTKVWFSKFNHLFTL